MSGDRSGLQRKRHYRLTRDGVLFGLGFLTFVHEVVWTSGDRVAIIGAALLMMGLPSALAVDNWRQGKK